VRGGVNCIPGRRPSPFYFRTSTLVVPFCTGPRPSITGGTYQCRLTGRGSTSVALMLHRYLLILSTRFSYFSFLSPARSWYASFLSKGLLNCAPKVFFSIEAPVDSAEYYLRFLERLACARTIPFPLRHNNCYRLRAQHSHPHRLVVHHSSSVYPCPSPLTSYRPMPLALLRIPAHSGFLFPR